MKILARDGVRMHVFVSLCIYIPPTVNWWDSCGNPDGVWRVLISERVLWIFFPAYSKKCLLEPYASLLFTGSGVNKLYSRELLFLLTSLNFMVKTFFSEH